MADEPKTPEKLTPEEIAQRKAALEEFTQQREALEKEADDIIKEVEFNPVKNLRHATFALTKEESQELARAQEIYFKTLRRFSNISDEDARNVAVINEIRQTVSNALKSGAVDLEKLNAIYERAIKEHLYWSILLSEIVIGSKSKGQPNADIYTIVSNFAPIDRKEIRMERGATQEVFDEQIAQLNIPDDVAFISDEDLYFLFTVPSLYKDTLDTPALEQKPPARPAFPNVGTFGIMNDKLNHIMRAVFPTIPADGQLTAILDPIIQGKKGKAPIMIYVSLTYEGENMKLSKDIRGFDLDVISAVATAYYYWNLYYPGTEFCITPQQIWRLINGTQDASRKPSAAQIRRVRDSMDKMRFTRIFMDISEEIESLNLSIEDDRVVKGIIDTTFLKADGVILTTESGKEYFAYKIEAEPILYTYNKAKNHVLFCDLRLLDTSSKTGNEGYTVEIRSYLLQQIQQMKSGRKRDSHRILYETLYKANGIPTPEERISRDNTRKEKVGTKKTDNTYQSNIRKEAKKDREKINALLDAFKEKGFIKGYTMAKKGNTYIGVDIDL